MSKLSVSSLRESWKQVYKSTLHSAHLAEKLLEDCEELEKQRDNLLAACKLALDAFENNWAIDWSILEEAIAEIEGQTKS